jgi:hypothetical protein
MTAFGEVAMAFRDRKAARTFRRQFFANLFFGVRIVAPVLSGLLAIIVLLGLVIGHIEGWSVVESIWFAFVSGLTIGYGDLAPKGTLTRILAILIGVCGVLVTALIAAVAVQALTAVRKDHAPIAPHQHD